MDEQTAKIVILVGAAVGAAFWLIAILLYRAMAAAETVQQFSAHLPGRLPGEAINDLLAEGRMFAAESRVDRLADDRLTVTQSGIEVSVEAVRESGGTRLLATLDDSRYTRKFLLGFAAYVLVLMPLVVGGAPLALWHFVAASDSAAVRGQALQVMQIVHLLWPPFLIYYLWKKLRERAANSVSNLLVYAQAHAAGSRQAD